MLNALELVLTTLVNFSVWGFKIRKYNIKMEGSDGSIPVADKTVSIIKSKNDLVNELLCRNFASLPHDEKLFIKNNGRPTPNMVSLVNTAVGGKGSNRSFNVNWYQKYQWLTGSETRNKLFCWPCLLFSTNLVDDKQNPWSRGGYDNLKDLFRALQKHDVSKSIHIAN